MADPTDIIVRQLGLVAYQSTVSAMQAFTAERTAATPDELWLLQHPPVFTLGLGGKLEHVIEPGVIPLVHTDRGGQVTYHGPGQLVVYVLCDLIRRAWTIRQLVWTLEESVLRLLGKHLINGERRSSAPGVYVAGQKLAALGLRIRRGCTYHGLAVNVAMDLSPFRAINPCGYPGLQVTQTSALGITAGIDELAEQLISELRLLLATKEAYAMARARARQG